MSILLYIPGDPGIPDGAGADPFAGLDEAAAGALRSALDLPHEVWVEWLVRSDDDLEGFDGWLRANHPELTEGKAIGTSDLSGGVAGRDAALRRAASSTVVTSHLRLAAKNIARDLAPVEEEVRTAVGMLLRMWLRGRMSYDDVRLQTARRWREAYESVREVGRRAAALGRLGVSDEVTREEEEWFRSAVREELRYWHVFLDEIHREQVPGRAEFISHAGRGRLNERFEAYLRALRFMYEGARALALPREALVYWMGPKKDDPEICEGCIYLMERSPFPKDRLPAVPRDGSTPCLTNCRHRIVVRMARSLEEVRRRRDTLPLREVMVRELEEIKEFHHGTHRQARAKTLVRQIRPGAANPFRGEPLPESAPPAGATCETCRRAGRGDVAATTMRKGAWRVWSYLCAECAARRDEATRLPDGSGFFVGTVPSPGEAAHDPEVVFDLPVVSGGVPTCPGGPDCPGGPGHEDHEAAAAPTTGRLMGKPAVINRPDHFRFAPDSDKDIVQRDMRGFVGQRIPPGAKVKLATEAAFDSPAYRNIDVMQVAMALASAAKQRPLNAGTIARLVDRLVAGLELAVLAVKGRPDATRFSSLLRAALASIEDGVEVRAEAVGSDDLRRPVARLRALVVEWRAEQLSDGHSPARGDGRLRPAHREPGRRRYAFGEDLGPLGPAGVPGD